MTTPSDVITLTDGFSSVPPGRVATVVTHLEMRPRPALRRAVAQPGLTLERVHAPALDWYRGLYRAVGEDWLWFSRLTMSDEALSAILNDALVEVYVLRHNMTEFGLLELDFRQNGACELAFFGLTPSHVGTGAGRFLMNRAIELAYSKPIERFHVHTCTLDHPAALGFYIRSGFKPFRQEIEIAPDPRLTGALPRTAAPQIPIFDDGV